MKAKVLLTMLVVALFLSPVWAAAQVLTRFDPLPDLVPVDMTLDTQCRVVVTLKNNGPGIVPDAGYSGSATGVQMYKEGGPWSGMVLGRLDPAHLSQPVGGTVTAAWFSNLPLTVGSYVMSLEVDNNNSVAEANEANNVLTKTLTCQLPAPDLAAVSISLTAQCQIVLTLMNVGTAPLPDAAFTLTNGSNVQMYSDGSPFAGILLGGLDLTKQLQPVGGTITYNWFPNLKLTPGGHVITVVADENNFIAELNEMNNSRTQNVSCGIWPPLIGDPPTTIKP
jgi:hypothetical protein